MKTIKISALLCCSLLTACGGGSSPGPASDESGNNNPVTITGGGGSTTTNTIAIAVAGTTLEVTRNTVFSLDGSGSADADGDTLTYTWTQTLGPDVTNGVGFLSGEFPTITAPLDVSTLGFELVVNDSKADSAPDTVQVNVMEKSGEAVFVDGTLGVGSDATGDGSRGAPYASVWHALSNLPAPNYDIYVRTISGQRYLEDRDVTAPAAVSWTVPDGTSLYGGFGDDWVRDVDANRTSVWLASRGVHFESVNQDTWFSGFELLAQNPIHWVHPESFGISADTGTATLYIQDNRIESDDVTAASASSYGLRLSNIGAVRILRNLISSGNGGGGTVGDSGLNGNSAADGTTATSQSGASGGHYDFCAWGSNAAGNCASLAVIATGGGGHATASISGGSGGRGGNQGGQNGREGNRGFRDGDPFNDPSGARGGAGGDFGHQDGHNGSGGFGGFHRSQAGAGGNGHGSISGGVFVNTSASNGARGGHGGGGGGGGGSEGNLGSDGGGGGGGGGGGVGGQGGKAGGSGGASIGILVSGIPNVLIEGNTVISANGGGGAAGGNGGGGGNGGDGGRGEVSGDQGGRGGGGGHGGQGGQGGAGGGGPSYSILVGAGMAPEIVQNTLQAGAGGSPAAGAARGGRWGGVGNGSGTGATGYHPTLRASDGSLAEGGWSYTVYDINPGDGLVPFVSNNSSTPGTAGSGGQAGAQNF